jgi:GTP pyrophosphokinase/guanosine-3',5'-bis(diphosphate) 3'-pyrophosphohydrolase
MVTQCIAETDCDIEDVIVLERDGTQNVVSFTVLVKSRQHLAEMMRYLRQLSAVQKINRA